jgi:hypothetical protein
MAIAWVSLALARERDRGILFVPLPAHSHGALGPLEGLIMSEWTSEKYDCWRKQGDGKRSEPRQAG